MRLHVVLTDDEGNEYEGEVALRITAGRVANRAAGRARRALDGAETRPDFSLPIRPFIKQYTKGLSGREKFAVLLARLTDGKIGPTQTLEEIRTAWNRMKELLGGPFNPAYSTRAKDEGWVHVERTGSYVLRSSWTAALSKKRG